MTLKYKIIFGFVLLMAITISASFVGYNGLSGASTRFHDYLRYSKMETSLSEFNTDLAQAATLGWLYLHTYKDADAKKIKGASSKAQEDIKNALLNAIEPEQKQILQELVGSADAYFVGLDELVGQAGKQSDQYKQVIVPKSNEGIIALDNISKITKENNNILLATSTGKTWKIFSQLMSTYATYRYSFDESDLKSISNGLSDLHGALEEMSTYITSGKERDEYGNLIDAVKVINDTTEQIKNSESVNQKLHNLTALRLNIMKGMDSVTAIIEKKTNSLLDSTIKSTDEQQSFLFTSSLVGIIAGIALALFTILGLIKALRDISSFAEAIAKGDFGYQVKTREKGEIGAMVSALKQIPLVLNSLISDTISDVKKIQVGQFNTRLDSNAYNGGYANIVNAVNTVAGAYTRVLDELPLPVISANKNNEVFYANRLSKESLEGKLVESFIVEGETDFGKQAIEQSANYKTEVSFEKNGKTLFMEIIALPLSDEDGKPVSFIETLSDLTEIKAQQKVMLDVAEEASELASRVAAASEEIAAQVEQVSRGADVQRERVESTASAMGQMTATVIEVARSANEAAEQSNATRSKADDGASLVNEVMGSINQVNTVSQNLHRNMQELGIQAESIGSVMNVISDIADQTNLLALNAAIEAARAGEAGRGFAVVADEVRKLAEKTMEATQEVGSSINAVQQSARVNVDEVNQAVRAVEEANKLASLSSKALEEILALASASSSVVAAIATSAEEQSATAEEVNGAIENISHIVSETSEGMRQSSSAIQDLSSIAQELRSVMKELQ